MNTRWVVMGLYFFGVATIAGLAFSLFGPIHLVRLLGVAAAICGGVGIALHASVLYSVDPTRFGHWHHRLANLFGPSRAPLPSRSRPTTASI